MMNLKNCALFLLESLSSEVKASNKIRSSKRLDCTLFANESNYQGFKPFYNEGGKFYVYKTSCDNFIHTDRKRLAEWSLTGNSLNLSSIYIDDFDFPEYAYGYPNDKKYLSNGKENPLFPFRNDAYLFILNKDYSVIEILVIPDARNEIQYYYQLLIDGKLDFELNRLRQSYKVFYHYL